MKKKTFVLLCTLLALCALLNTAVFALEEGEWFLPAAEQHSIHRI